MIDSGALSRNEREEKGKGREVALFEWKMWLQKLLELHSIDLHGHAICCCSAECRKWTIFCPAMRHRNKIYKRKRKCKNEEEDQRDIHTPNEYVTSTCNLFCSRLNASIPPPFIPAIPVLRCNVRFCCEGSKKIRMAKQEDQDSWLQRVNDKDSSG